MNGFPSTEKPGDNSGEVGRLSFLVNDMLSRMCKVRLVKVMSVYTFAGDVSEYAVVDVQPLIMQIDGEGNGFDHGIIPKVPVWTYQGGKGAFVILPSEGDIGLCLFTDRDFTTAKQTQDFATPGAWGKHTWSNGIYFGGVLNGTPEVTVTVSGSSIDMVGAVGIEGELNVSGPVGITGDVSITGSLTVNGHLIT